MAEAFALAGKGLSRGQPGIGRGFCGKSAVQEAGVAGFGQGPRIQPGQKAGVRLAAVMPARGELEGG